MKLKRNTNFKNVVLSDVLPYEIPVIFSNRRFYNFINKYEFSHKDNIINYNCKNKKNEQLLKEVSSILFGGEYSKSHIQINQSSKLCFQFKIQHKENSFRELSLPHPKTQLEATDFYEKYSSLILYYSNRSAFSMRKALHTAKFIVEKNNVFFDSAKYNFSRTY